MTEPKKEIDKVKLYMPVEMWSEILMRMDMKVETICKQYGFGKVEMSLTIVNGNVVDIIFTDEVRVRGLANPPPKPK